MSRAPLADRTAAVEVLGPCWQTFLREFSHFALLAPDGSAGRVGRLEAYAWAVGWPARVAEESVQEAKRIAVKGNGHVKH